MWSWCMTLGLKKLSNAADFIYRCVVWDRFEGSPAVADFRFGNVRNGLIWHKVFSHTLDEVVVGPLNDSRIIKYF